jgi:hypothetical protein
MMDVTFTFEDDETYHDDLVLRIGDSVWRCDSYYLLIDREILPDDEDSSKVRVVLHTLLKSWRKAIEDLTDGTTVYLPYDFSDECSAWLACELVKAELLIRRGWADVEGWSIFPSAPPAPVTRPVGFRPDAGAWTMSVEDFLKGIDRSIAATL